MKKFWYSAIVVLFFFSGCLPESSKSTKSSNQDEVPADNRPLVSGQLGSLPVSTNTGLSIRMESSVTGPIANSLLVLVSSDGTIESDITDSSGNFDLRYSPGNSYTIFVFDSSGNFVTPMTFNNSNSPNTVGFQSDVTKDYDLGNVTVNLQTKVATATIEDEEFKSPDPSVTLPNNMGEVEFQETQESVDVNLFFNVPDNTVTLSYFEIEEVFSEYRAIMYDVFLNVEFNGNTYALLRRSVVFRFNSDSDSDSNSFDVSEIWYDSINYQNNTYVNVFKYERRQNNKNFEFVLTPPSELGTHNAKVTLSDSFKFGKYNGKSSLISFNLGNEEIPISLVFQYGLEKVFRSSVVFQDGAERILKEELQCYLDKDGSVVDFSNCPSLLRDFSFTKNGGFLESYGNKDFGYNFFKPSEKLPQH